MKLLLDNNNVILDISEDMMVVEPFISVTKNNGTYNYMLVNKTICEVLSIPENVVAQKYCYDTTTHEFTLNPTYVEYIPETVEKNTEGSSSWLDKLKNFFN